MYDMAYATNLQVSFGNMYMYMYSWMACLYYFRPRPGRKQGSTHIPVWTRCASEYAHPPGHTTKPGGLTRPTSLLRRHEFGCLAGNGVSHDTCRRRVLGAPPKGPTYSCRKRLIFVVNSVYLSFFCRLSFTL